MSKRHEVFTVHDSSDEEPRVRRPKARRIHRSSGSEPEADERDPNPTRREQNIAFNISLRQDKAKKAAKKAAKAAQDAAEVAEAAAAAAASAAQEAAHAAAAAAEAASIALRDETLEQRRARRLRAIEARNTGGTRKLKK